jgi:hypothetical protein
MENRNKSVIGTTRSRKFNTRGYAIGIGVSVALLVIATVAGIHFIHQNNTSLPSSIIRATNFALYYPVPLPSAYTYKNHSAKMEGSVVFYELQSGSRTITVGEQAAPSNQPSLTHLTDFTTLQTSAGKAAIGTSLGKPVAIIISNTTLITINGTQTVPSDVISTIAKAMSSLPQ